jgi:3-oxoacyl-[acyl-carrier protein] reductase
VVTPSDDTTRVAIVTGDSRGLGREMTRKLADRGYAVVVYYAWNQRAAEAAVQEVLAANGAALAVRGDVDDELDVERLFAETIEAFGGVDVVVHVVGQIVLGLVSDGDADTFDLRWPRSVRGTFIVNRQTARELRDGGAIINLYDCVGGLALRAPAAYGASKGAVDSITRLLASELGGRDVTVNAVALELKRPAVAAEVVGIVSFLASEAGHGVNGQVIRLNGGLVENKSRGCSHVISEETRDRD